jgi:hypothetical protein
MPDLNRVHTLQLCSTVLMYREVAISYVIELLLFIIIWFFMIMIVQNSARSTSVSGPWSSLSSFRLSLLDTVVRHLAQHSPSCLLEARIRRQR